MSDVTKIAQPTDFTPPSAKRASLIVVAGWEIGREIEIKDCPQVLGRSASADVSITSPSVSRKHSQIEHVQESDETFFVISDLGSSNGTYVNDTPAAGARLENGDRIRMGDVLFKFVLQDEIEAEYHQQVHRLIHYDQLTGLLTMETFRRRLDAAIKRGSAENAFTLAMTDLDGLKRVNDTYGHLAGRMIVQEMGTMIRSVLRPHDHAALYGGDETVLLFTNANLDEARELAEQLRRSIEERVFEHQGNSFQVTISQGLAEWPRHGESAEALIAKADKALYAAKSAGRNCVVCADDTDE